MDCGVVHSGPPRRALKGLSPHFSPRRSEAAFLECGDSSPLLLAATRRGEPAADESAVEEAGASSRTPKRAIPPRTNCWRTAGGGTSLGGSIMAVLRPTVSNPGEKSGLRAVDPGAQLPLFS